MFFLKNICILCLCDDKKNLLDISHLDENNISLQNKLEYCMAELFNFNFEIPKQICFTCQQYLNFDYTFKQKCVENNNRLKMYINQLKSEKLLAENKYQNLQVRVADIKPTKSFKLDEKVHFNYGKRTIKNIPETYVPLQDNIDNIAIKEEFVIDSNENNYFFNQIKLEDITNSELEEILISEAGQNVFDDETDSSNYNNKQMTTIATRNNQNVVLEPGSSVSKYETKLAENKQNHNDNSDTDETIDSEQTIKCFDVPKIKRNTITAKYHCTFCEKHYISTAKLDKHLRNYHQEVKPFHCKICSAKYQFRSELNSHLNKTHNRNDSSNYNNKQMTITTTNNQNVVLEPGSSVLKQETKLAENKQNHNEISTTNNSDTDETSDSEQTIKTFDVRKIKRNAITGKYQCTFCEKSYFGAHHLDTHLRKYHLDTPFHCKICSAKFQSRSILNSHVNKTHHNTRIYACTVCDKKFPKYRQLTGHLQIHQEKTFQCKICSTYFRRKDHLINHMTTHTGQKAFGCPVCDKKFNIKANSISHLRVHTGFKPYICSICGKTFKAWTHHRDHMDSHVGYKRYACSVCSCRYSFGASFKKHMMTHSGVRPFKCSVCSKGFLSKWHLREHVKIHSKSRVPRILEKVKCEICGKLCGRGSAIKRHIMKKHESNIVE